MTHGSREYLCQDLLLSNINIQKDNPGFVDHCRQAQKPLRNNSLEKRSTRENDSKSNLEKERNFSGKRVCVVNRGLQNSKEFKESCHLGISRTCIFSLH